MNAKTQKLNLRSAKIQSASFLLWIISGLYLLTMVWFLLLSPMGGYGAQEGQPWLVPAVVLFTVSYGILMLLLWPHEKASSEGRTIAFRRPFYLKDVNRLLPRATIAWLRTKSLSKDCRSRLTIGFRR